MDELKLMIAQLTAASDTRAKDLSDRMTVRDNLDSEFRGEMRGAMKTLQGTQTDQEKRLKVVEKTSEDAREMARAAMQSHDSLQVDLRAEVGEVKEMLTEQNDDVVRRERVKKDEHEQESLAAKRVNEKREFNVKMATVWAPILGIVFTAVAGAWVAYVNSRSHDDMAARVERLTNSLTTGNSVSPSMGQNFSPIQPSSPRLPTSPASAASKAP